MSDEQKKDFKQDELKKRADIIAAAVKYWEAHRLISSWKRFWLTKNDRRSLPDVMTLWINAQAKAALARSELSLKAELTTNDAINLSGPSTLPELLTLLGVEASPETSEQVRNLQQKHTALLQTAQDQMSAFAAERKIQDAAEKAAASAGRSAEA